MNSRMLVCAAAIAALFSMSAFAQTDVDVQVPRNGRAAVPASQANEVFYPPNYFYEAPDDVDGDGLSDLLWFNAEKSKIGYWLSQRVADSASAYVRGPTQDVRRQT